VQPVPEVVVHLPVGQSAFDTATVLGRLRPRDRRCESAVFVEALGSRSGADGNRTHDLFHAMEALSQLSYGPEQGT
jgi:hypothetical protein